MQNQLQLMQMQQQIQDMQMQMDVPNSFQPSSSPSMSPRPHLINSATAAHAHGPPGLAAAAAMSPRHHVQGQVPGSPPSKYAAPHRRAQPPPQQQQQQQQQQWMGAGAEAGMEMGAYDEQQLPAGLLDS